jgi:hypothetical protein
MRAAVLVLLLAGCAGAPAMVIRVDGMQRGSGGKT